MNTCKSVSKQKTLTTFRMNTYEKRGGGVGSQRIQTGHIPDTSRTSAIACKTSAGHGDRAVRLKKSFDLSLNTNGRNPTMTELCERYEITRQQPIANFTFSASSQIRRLVTVRRGDRG